MNLLPNPWLSDSVAPAADEPAVASNPPPVPDATADPFNDEPLPLFLTEPAPGLDRDLEAMLRVIFGVHS